MEHEKKMSPDLDDKTMDKIMGIYRMQEKGCIEADCELCGAPILGTHYDKLRNTPRRCQLCKMLGEQKGWSDSQ